MLDPCMFVVLYTCEQLNNTIKKEVKHDNITTNTKRTR